MMNRRVFIGGVVGALLVALNRSDAQVAGRTYRVGYLGQGSNPAILPTEGRSGTAAHDLRARVEGRT